MFLAIERGFIFKPTPAGVHWEEPPPDLAAEDVWLRLPSGPRLHAWWCPTPGWTPAAGAVLYCHGNAGNLSHRGEGIRRWRDRVGAAVLLFDYPGYGHSTGKPSEPGCYAAADAYHDWLVQTRGIVPERIVLHGGSLGGAVAIDLAARRPYRAMVVVSAFTSVADMARLRFGWLPVHRFLQTRFDNLAKISACPGRFLLAHGTADSVIPFSMGERLFAAAREPKQFFPLEGYDHQHSPGPEFYGAVAHFLEVHAPLV